MGANWNSKLKMLPEMIGGGKEISLPDVVLVSTAFRFNIPCHAVEFFYCSHMIISVRVHCSYLNVAEIREPLSLDHQTHRRVVQLRQVFFSQ